MSYYSGPLSVRAVADMLVCPTQAWLEARGPRIAWNRPHWSPGDPEDPLDLGELYPEVLGGPPDLVVEQQYLESRSLRLRGVADVVAYRGGRAVVVEVKGRGPAAERDRVQAGLYALILEDEGFEAWPVVAWPGGYEVLGREYVVAALRVLEEARRVLASGAPPPPGGVAPCAACNYRMVCPYRV